MDSKPGEKVLNGGNGDDHLRLVIEASPSGMIMIEQSGSIVLVNSQVEKLFGYAREELLGQSIEILVPEAARAHHPGQRESFFAKPSARAMGVGRDLFGLHKDGREVPVEIGLTPLTIDGKQFVLASIVDITERKKAEKVLSDSEERFRLLMSGVKDYAIILLNPQGLVESWNEGAQRIKGYSADEIIGKHLSVFYTPEDVRIDKSAYELRRAEADGRFEDEGWRVRKDGSRFIANVIISAMRDEQGNLRGFAKITRDVTEQKRADERLRLVVEASPSGLLMVDKTGKILLVNSQLEKLFGYSRDELVGQPMEILVPTRERAQHPGYRQEFHKAPTGRAMGAGRDLFGLRKDGTEIPLEIGISPIVSDGEDFVLASVVDITERKRLETLLRDNITDLKRSNEDLQQFAYVCSHDLQEPLRVISNYTQLIARRYKGTLDESADQFIDFTVDATKRMQGLINDLLTYSRVETRGHDFVPVDAGNLVEMAAANLKMAIEETGTTLNADSLPSIVGDSSQLLQLFQNLIGNAIKFRSEKSPVINVTANDQGNAWLFTVEDNGQGFDMKYAERIFIIFQRLHTKEMYPGSGIGLAICKKIAERHGGAIWAESRLGAGTAFHFTIPKSRNKQEAIR